MEEGFAQGYAVGRDSNNGGYGNGCGFGYGGDWIWIILLFALFGNGGFGFGGGGLGYDFPWLLTGQNAINNNTNDGFRDATMASKLDSISSALCNNEINSLQTAYNNQIASMNQNFAMQQAFSNCCCEQKLGTADLKATVISENCADREALSNGIRDIISNNTANTQRILDKLCDQELQAERRENANLRSELMYARGQASQIDQTARILAGQTAEVDALYNRLNNCPVPTTPVYGRTPIFTCPNNNNGCGCGCGNNNF